MHRTYLFVRKDLSPEQVVVQAAHVAMYAGNVFEKAHKRNLVVIEVADQNRLLDAIIHLVELGIKYQTFIESNGVGLTSVCTDSVDPATQIHLKGYQLLRFDREEETSTQTQIGIS